LTFKDLKNQLESLLPSSGYEQEFDILKNKPFWIWNRDQHKQQDFLAGGNCCFNHIIGLPVKNGKQYPIFEYEKLIFDAIEKNQNIWIKKARGLGVTTFLIRYLVWKILLSAELDGKSIFIVSGTREEFANYVKKKMEQLFERRFPDLVLDSKYTELILKKTWIKVMPTKNIKDIRGYMDAAYLFIDEADFFNPNEQEELEPAITAYEEKSKGKTIMVSTPNAPGGLFERIERDENSKYRKLFLDYTYGLGKIYDAEYIERKKLEPEFEREYNLKYLGHVGNVFHIHDIEIAIKEYDIENEAINNYAVKSMGVDPGFGSSAFGIVVTRLVNGKIQITFADEYERPDYNDMLSKIIGLISRYNIDHIYVDGANPEVVSNLKRGIGERSRPEQYSHLIERARKYGRGLENYMKVIPVHFAREHKELLAHSKMALEKGCLEIHPQFDKLRIALRTAFENGEGILDKEATSHDDIFDAFRLSLKYYRID
jgi:hypothetical protein